MKALLTGALLIRIFSALNAWAGINDIEYSQKYSRQNQQDTTAKKDNSCGCKYCAGAGPCNINE